MNSIALLALSLYLADFHELIIGVFLFARLLGPSRFICISEALFSWSNKGEMQI